MRPPDLDLPESSLTDNPEQLRARIDALEFELAEIHRRSAGGTWAWPDVDEPSVYVSPGLCRALGFDVPGRMMDVEELFALTHPEDAPRLRAQVDELRERGGLYSAEFRWLLDGQSQWARTFGEFIRTPAGRVTAQGSTTFVIGEVQLARARDEAVDKLRHVMENVGVHLWEWPSVGDSPLEISGIVNPAEEPAEENLDDPWHAYVHPDDHPRFLEALDVVLAEPGSFSIEVRARLAGEAYRWYVCRGASELRGGGKLRAAGTLFDIDDRRAAERQAEAARAKLSLVIEGARGGVFDWPDVEREYIRLDDSLIDLTGYDPDEVQHSLTWCMNAVHPDDRDRVSRSLQASIVHGEKYDSTFRFRFRDRGYRYVRSLAVVSTDAATESRQRLTGMILDVDERVRAEQRLAAANRQLDGFASLVAHDLKATLRHITSLADVLHEEYGACLDEIAHDYIGRIKGSGEVAAGIIRDLHAYAKTGTTPLYPAPIDLGLLVQEVRGSLSLDGAAEHVDWHIGALPTVQADPTQMRMLLQNLLANAIKFTRHSDEPRIWVEGTQLDDAEVELRVRDNGAGFAQRHHESIFEAFQRAHEPGDFEGSGIGLANVARIVARHGGRVRAVGSPGEGAEFVVVLPTAQAAE